MLYIFHVIYNISYEYIHYHHAIYYTSTIDRTDRYIIYHHAIYYTSTIDRTHRYIISQMTLIQYIKLIGA